MASSNVMSKNFSFHEVQIINLFYFIFNVFVFCVRNLVNVLVNSKPVVTSIETLFFLRRL